MYLFDAHRKSCSSTSLLICKLSFLFRLVRFNLRQCLFPILEDTSYKTRFLSMHAYYTTCYILHISVVKISFIPFSNEIDIIISAATTKMTYLLKSTSLLDAAILETSVPIKIKTPWSQMLPAIQVRFMNDG